MNTPVPGYSNVTINEHGIPVVDIDWDARIFASLRPGETRGNWRRTVMVIAGKSTEVLEHVYKEVTQ